MTKINLVEVPGEAVVAGTKSSLLLLADGKLRRICEQESAVVGVVSLDEPTHARIDGETLLIESYRTKRQESRHLSRLDTTIEATELISPTVLAADRRIFECKTASKANCLCSTADNGDSDARVYSEAPSFVTDDRSIFVRTTKGLVECLDENLREVWSRSFPRRHTIVHGALEPMLAGDGVLVLLGWDASRRRDGEIVRLSKDTGHTVWSRVFEGHPSNCFLRENRLYFAEGGRFWVLEAQTGETVLHGDIGLHDSHGARLWIDGSHLYVFTRSALRAFTERGSLVEDWHLPQPYRFRLRDVPVVVDRNAYVLAPADSNLKLRTTATALIRIPIDRGGTNTGTRGSISVQMIQPESWPVEAHVYATAFEKKVRYHVTIRGSDINEVTRYGSILLRWVAWARGSIRLSEFRQNKKFDGTIYLSCAGVEREAEVLGGMLQRIRSLIEKQDEPFAGDQKGPISFEVVPMPEAPPGLEEPIGALVTPSLIHENTRVEKMPVAVTLVAARAMTKYQDYYASAELAEKWLRSASRRTDSGTSDLLRDGAGWVKQDEVIAAFYPQPTGPPSGSLLVQELGECAAWCYANIGWLFYSKQDCHDWFRALSKLARAICKKAPKDDKNILEVYEIVDALADVGRAKFEARKAAGEFSYAPPWDV